MPRMSLKAELMERAIVDDMAARALGSFRDASFCTSSAGSVGVGAGVSADGFDLRRKCITIVDVQINDWFGLEAD